MRSIAACAFLLVGLVAVVDRGPAQAADPDQREPGPKCAGHAYAWKSADGLAYEYFVPKDYDAAKGANLVLILHGSNLDRHWGFRNHVTGDFRPDDLIVCPDGTTSNGNGGFNFLQGAKDLQRLRALHEELKAKFKVRATYVYGHSQGSFFSFLYAGAYPEHVQGVVGQASGVWIGTAATQKHHHQAIALLHGTADPVVPYAQSVGGLEFYRDAKYPLCRLRSLEGWNHWPNQDQTALELAWCEGMTSNDPARVAAAYEALADAKPGNGYDRDASALFAVAQRAATLADAPADLRGRASKCAEDVNGLAKRHADAIAKSLGKGRGDKLEDAAWVGHLPEFIRDFEGVPACDALAKEWADRLDRHKSAAQKSLREYYRVRDKDPAKAFPAGVEAIRDGHLWYECASPDFLEALAKCHGDAKKLKLGKSDLKAYDEVVAVFVSARKKGLDAYADLNRKQ